MVANPIIGNKQTRVMLQILPQLNFKGPWTTSVPIGQDADN